MTANDILSGAQQGLAQSASIVVDEMKRMVSNNGLPQVISSAMSIDAPETDGENASIDIVIDLGAAPMAAAFEWGSGIHATRGPQEKYLIEGNPYLAIPRSRWPNYTPPPDVDPVVLRRVMHPGVAARPYIAPSVKSTEKQVMEILGKEFKASILLGEETVVIIS